MTSRYRSHAPFGIGAEQFPGVGELGSPLPTEQAVDREISLNAADKEQYRKVSDWFDAHAHQKILFLELGVGEMTPGIITLPFWSMTAKLPDAHLLSVNITGDSAPLQLGSKEEAIQADLSTLLSAARTGNCSMLKPAC